MLLNKRFLSASVPHPNSVAQTCILRHSAQALALLEAAPVFPGEVFPESHVTQPLGNPSFLLPRRTVGLSRPGLDLVLESESWVHLMYDLGSITFLLSASISTVVKRKNLHISHFHQNSPSSREEHPREAC